MHIFKMSVTYMQSFKKDTPKTLGGVDFTMHYQPLFNMCSGQELAIKVKNGVNLSKIIFSSLNFNMHILNMSVTYLQSFKKIHRRL